MATTFFTEEIKNRFFIAWEKFQDAHLELLELQVEAEEEQELELIKGNECEVLDEFLGHLSDAIDSLSEADNTLESVSMEVEDKEE